MAKVNFVAVKEAASDEKLPIIENSFDKRDSILFKGPSVDLAHLTACLASGKPYHGLPCSKQNVVFWAPFEFQSAVSDVFHKASKLYGFDISDVSTVKASADMNYWYMSEFFEALEHQITESKEKPDVFVISFGGNFGKEEIATKAAFVKEFMSNVNSLINKFGSAVIFSFEPLLPDVNHNRKKIEKLNNDIFIKENISASVTATFKTKVGFWHRNYPEHSAKR